MSKRSLSIGILGTGAITSTVIPAMRMAAGVTVGAIASRSGEKARRAAENHGIPLSFGSYGDLMDSHAVDAIYIALPNALHAQWTIKALEQGYPVLCEKPLTVTLAEAKEVAAASRRTCLPVQEAFMYRHHPVYDALRERIRSGAIGGITSVHSVFSYFLEDRSETPASASLGGGALLDVGCYCVDFSRLVIGCEPTSAFAVARSGTVDDLLMGILAFPGGVLASFETSIASNERQWAAIHGTTGSIVLPSPWHPDDGRGTYVIERWQQKPETVCIPGRNPYALEVEAFAASLGSGMAPRWTIDDAVAGMAVIEALRDSAADGMTHGIPD